MTLLQDFVKETLVQIANGAKEASEEVLKAGGVVNPVNSGFIPNVGKNGTSVQFDVALATSEEQSKSGKFGVVVFDIGMGVKGGAKTDTTSTSRVAFSVPLLLPIGGELNRSKPYITPLG